MTAVQADIANVDHRELLQKLVETRASDLHCKPGNVPVLRIAGALVRQEDLPVLSATDVATLAGAVLDQDMQAALVESGCVVAAHSEPGIGRFRISAFRQRGSISLVVHTVADDILTLDELGLPPVVATLAGGDRGLVLVASPVGNGLTTTLASMVDHVNRTRGCHVLTVDEPIEVLHPDETGFVSQLEVGADVPSIAHGIRSASRVDADVVSISDLAGRDAVDAALDAVARGRLVFAGIGAATVAGAIHAVLELYSVAERAIVREALARSLSGILAQQLLPSVKDQPVVAVEALVRTAKIQECIADPERISDLRHLLEEGSYNGMQTMDQALVGLVQGQKISIDVALAAAVDPEELRITLVR